MTSLATLVVGILVVGLAAIADQSITLVSVSEDGTATGATGPVAVSDDGRYVAFVSSESDLVPDDTNTSNDVFVKDLQTGDLVRASVSSSAVQGDAGSGPTVDISDDGRYALFQSSATNLVAGDTNNAPDIFIRDLEGGTTERVLRDDGSQGTGAANSGAISGDGRYVAFVGAGYEDGFASNDWGVYVYDRSNGALERITDGAAFVTTSSTYADVDISDDGRYVAFTTGEFGQFDDVVLFDRDTDTYQIANPRIGGARPQSAHPSDLALSGDGRFVSFGSPDTNYVAGDPADTNDVFVYDADTESLERIAGGGATVSQDPNPVISDDGRYVAFIAGLDIYGAANGYADIVKYDRDTDSGVVVSVFDDGSPGDGSSGAFLYEPAISGDGRFVAFITGVEFDANDPGNSDIYITDAEGLTGPPGECVHGFTDVDGNIFEQDICWMAQQGITLGCDTAGTIYCPGDHVTRGQMASFLVRALDLPAVSGNRFSDVAGTHLANINALAEAGITLGCNTDGTLFCPNDLVTRAQMGSFLARALELDPVAGDRFDDVAGTHEANINAIAEEGITLGCTPDGTLYCPDDFVTRGQMAAFLFRGLG